MNTILNGKHLILGSKSPRRSFLLESLDLKFEVRNIEVEEIYDENLAPDKVVEYLAQLKTKAYSQSLKENEIVLCSDTVVVFENNIIGKPKDAQHAKEIITSLSDNTHFVYTGVCMKSIEKEITFHDISQVDLMPLDQNEIDYYVDKYQPMDKAGAYGIQEWIGYSKIKSIKGSYSNIMGLPVHKVYAFLKTF